MRRAAALVCASVLAPGFMPGAWVAPRRDFAVLVTTNQGGDEAATAADEAASALISSQHPKK